MSELVKLISIGIIGFKNKDRDMSPHTDVTNRNGGLESGMKEVITTGVHFLSCFKNSYATGHMQRREQTWIICPKIRLCFFLQLSGK